MGLGRSNGETGRPSTRQEVRSSVVLTRSGNPILSSHNSPILAPRIGTCGAGLSSRKRPAKIIAVGWFPVGGRYPRCSPPIGPGWGRISSMYSLHALNCRSAGLGSGAGKSRRWCHGGRYPGPRRTASSLKAPPCRDQSVRALVVSGIRLRTLRREQARWHQRPPTHRRLTADSPPTHRRSSVPHCSIHARWPHKTVQLGPRLRWSIVKIRTGRTSSASYVAGLSIPVPSVPWIVLITLTRDPIILFSPERAESGRVGKASR